VSNVRDDYDAPENIGSVIKSRDFEGVRKDVIIGRADHTRKDLDFSRVSAWPVSQTPLRHVPTPSGLSHAFEHIIERISFLMPNAPFNNTGPEYVLPGMDGSGQKFVLVSDYGETVVAPLSQFRVAVLRVYAQCPIEGPAVNSPSPSVCPMGSNCP
jgi:hypothetical protein